MASIDLMGAESARKLEAEQAARVHQCQADRAAANLEWGKQIMEVRERCGGLLDTCEAARKRFEERLMREGR